MRVGLRVCGRVCRSFASRQRLPARTLTHEVAVRAHLPRTLTHEVAVWAHLPRTLTHEVAVRAHLLRTLTH